ncbi:MAG: hypothetical protein J5917_01105 [Bacteroidales bacterium]|nr:hypothetical protein [Bacteroidales bacterium]
MKEKNYKEMYSAPECKTQSFSLEGIIASSGLTTPGFGGGWNLDDNLS